MILWKTHAEWADAIYSWARGFGLNDSVLTVDDLSTGDDVESTGDTPDQLLMWGCNAEKPNQIVFASCRTGGLAPRDHCPRFEDPRKQGTCQVWHTTCEDVLQ